MLIVQERVLQLSLRETDDGDKYSHPSPFVVRQTRSEVLFDNDNII